MAWWDELIYIISIIELERDLRDIEGVENKGVMR